MLSFHRFKLYRTRMQMAEGGLTQATRTAPEDEQNRLLTVKPCGTNPDPRQRSRPFSPLAADFGDDGLRHQRRDRLLTELATRAIAVIDKGLQQLVTLADADAFLPAIPFS